MLEIMEKELLVEFLLWKREELFIRFLSKRFLEFFFFSCLSIGGSYGVSFGRGGCV